MQYRVGFAIDPAITGHGFALWLLSKEHLGTILNHWPRMTTWQPVGVQTRNATDSHRHRQTIAQIKIMKSQKATQAIAPPAHRQKGRTVEPHNIQAIWPGPGASQIAICMSIDIIRAGCLRAVALGRVAKRPTAPICGSLLGNVCAEPVTSVRDRSNRPA